MKPVKQTKFGSDGNCLQAAVASLMEMELDEVPDFVHQGDEWWFKFRDWFAERNIAVNWSSEFAPLDSWHIVSVKSPRFEGETHAIVCDPTGAYVHDPHPEVDDPTINSDPVGYYWFYVIDPAKMAG